MAEIPAAAEQDNVRRLVGVLNLSGAVAIVIGVVLGFVVSPVCFLAVALGIADFVLAGLFSSGRIGPLAARRKATESGDAAVVAEADPSFNPYARED